MENREGEGGIKPQEHNTRGSFKPTSTAFLLPKIEDMVNWAKKQVYLAGLHCISVQEILNFKYGDTFGKIKFIDHLKLIKATKCNLQSVVYHVKISYH